MYLVIISRMSNESDVLSNVVQGRLTHNSAVTWLALVPKFLHNRSDELGTQA
jgi:hypothetical protein